MVTDQNIGLLQGNTVVKLLVEQNASCAADGTDGPDPYNFEVLSESPRVFYYPNFLSQQECDTMVKMGKEWVKPSMVTAGDPSFMLLPLCVLGITTNGVVPYRWW
jgi:hypothetical protein